MTDPLRLRGVNPKLDEQFKRAWVNALRSDEFYQVRRKLRDNDNGRCCLGVACDVAAELYGKGGWDDNYYFRGRNFIFPHEDNQNDNLMEHNAGSLPETLANYLGVSPQVWVTLFDGTEISLATLNDEYFWSFGAIATFIEEEL